MRKLSRLVAMAIIGFAGTALAQGASSGGDAANGKKVFMADGCYQCHGTVGQGSRGTGPRLAPKPLPYDAFSKQVREPINVMPPYTKVVLSDKDLGDLYAYLNTVPPPADAKDAAILNR